MSRTRIVGGTLTIITGGEHNIYSETDIVFTAGTTITETGVENGISFGEPKSPPKIDREQLKTNQNTIFTACIQFYRSKEHAQRNYGNKDTSYNGEFGFDKFDQKVCAEGLIGEYQELNGIIPDKETINGIKKYLCAYLSIWPPSVEGNLNSAKSKVKLYVKAEKASTQLASTGDIEFTSSNPNIVINGSSTLTLTIDDDNAKELSIECKGTFENDVYIEAKAKGESQVLGKLLIKANAVRYKTIIQPVLVNFSPTATFVKDEPLTSLDFPFSFKDFIDHLNTKSFNQAYILCDKPLALKTYGIVKNELITSNLISQDPNDQKYYLAADGFNRKKFNNKIEELYAASQNGKGAETIHKENMQALKDSGVSEAIEKYIEKFKTEYDYTNDLNDTEKIKKKHADKIVTEALNQKKVTELYSDYLIKRKEYDRIIATKGISPQAQKINKVKTIHVFVYSGIEGAYNGTVPGVAAYSLPFSGVVHIFNTTSKHKEVYSLIAHEMGHSLGLPHTFEKQVDNNKNEVYKEYRSDDSKQSEQTLKQNKKDKEKELKETNKKIEQKEVIATDNGKINSINYDYIDLKNRLNNSPAYIQNPDSFEKQIIIFSNSIKDSEASVIASNNSETFVEKKLRIEKEILEIEKELKTAEKAIKLSTYKEQSTTEENYMDYFIDNSGNINSNFKFQIFSQSQWKIMQKVGLNYKFLIN
jgi:Metallo-peptidase family M12B Reprolysin-like